MKVTKGSLSSLINAINETIDNASVDSVVSATLSDTEDDYRDYDSELVYQISAALRERGYEDFDVDICNNPDKCVDVWIHDEDAHYHIPNEDLPDEISDIPSVVRKLIAAIRR